MLLLLKRNARLQFKAKLQGDPRKGKVSKRPKDVDVHYNSMTPPPTPTPPPPPSPKTKQKQKDKSDYEENLDSNCSVV